VSTAGLVRDLPMPGASKLIVRATPASRSCDPPHISTFAPTPFINSSG
jgi:hypothetical protein